VTDGPPAPPDADVRAALLAAAGPDGAWPRLPQSARHDPAAWAACEYLADEGLARSTGDVRGDRAEYRATDRGRSVCAAMLAIQTAKPRKPRLRVRAEAVPMSSPPGVNDP
jgi:hypothetical protein